MNHAYSAIAGLFKNNDFSSYPRLDRKNASIISNLELKLNKNLRPKIFLWYLLLCREVFKIQFEIPFYINNLCFEWAIIEEKMGSWYNVPCKGYF